MTLHTTLNPLLPSDNTTALVVASVNVPFLTIADAYDAHISGAADNHATTAVTDAAFAGTVAITDAQTTTFTRLRQLMTAMINISGVATSSFATAMGTLPTTLTAVNATLAAATNLANVSTLMKRDLNADFAARDATLRNGTFSGTLTTGSGPTTLTDAAGKVLSAALNTVAIAQGGTGATTAATARAALGAAASGANGDITALSGLTTPLSVAQGGTGAATLTGVVIGTGTSAFAVKANPAGAFVGDTDAQTLTNKTLTAPTITSPTMSGTIAVGTSTYSGTPTFAGNATFGAALIAAAVGPSAGQQHALPAVASDTIALLAATQTLANKTLGTSNTIAVTTTNLTIRDGADTTKILKFDTSGLTTAVTRTLVVPDANDTLALLAATQTLTNKTLSGGALAGTLAGSPTLSGNPAFSGNPTFANPIPVSSGGTGGATAAAARSALGTAASGANSDITALTGLSTALGIAYGGTGAITALAARAALGVPATDGTGATGTWTVNTSGYAAGVNGVIAGALVRGAGVGTPATALTGSAAGQVVQWDGAQWVASSTAASDYSLTLTKLAGGAVTPHGGDLSIVVGATNDVAIDGTFTPYPGEIIDLTTYRPGSPGNTLWLLVYLNGTATARIQQGIEAAAPTKPMQQAYTKGLAYVRLAYNQTTITSADIVEARVDYQTFLGAGGSGSGVFAPLAHIHGAGGTAQVPVTGLDEGQILLPGTPGNSIIVTPMTMVDANGIVFRTLQQTVSCNTLPSASPRWDTVALTQSGAAYIRSGVEAASPAKIAPTNVTDYVRGYIYMRPSGSRTILTDDGVNNLVYDLRPISGINQPSAQGSNANVAGGGTGQITFTQGILYSPGGVSPFLTYPATIATSGTVGILQNPSLTISPAGSTSELFNFGGTLVSGGTGGTTLRTVHIAAPTLSGGGTWTNVRSLQVDGPGFGTNPVAIFTGGTAQFGLTITPTLGPSLTQQHTIPAVAADTFSLLGAAQSFTGVKTFSAPPIFTGLSGPLIGNGGSAITALTPVNGSLLGSVGGVPVYRNAAGIRADAATNIWPARATWDQKPPASGVAGNIEYFPIPAAMTLQQNPASGLAHIAIVGTAPATSTQTFNLTKRLANGTLGTVGAVGTVTVTTGGVVNVIINTTTFVAGDELQISAPATQNTAMANIRLQFILDY
jgi:hypothetical protein